MTGSGFIRCCAASWRPGRGDGIVRGKEGLLGKAHQGAACAHPLICNKQTADLVTGEGDGTHRPAVGHGQPDPTGGQIPGDVLPAVMILKKRYGPRGIVAGIHLRDGPAHDGLHGIQMLRPCGVNGDAHGCSSPGRKA